MSDQRNKTVSVFRLRIGIVLLMLWMLPFWWFGPGIAEFLGINTPKGVSTVTFIIVAIQTVIGIIGAVIAGKEVTGIVKGTKVRKMPKKVWRILRSGSTDIENS